MVVCMSRHLHQHRQAALHVSPQHTLILPALLRGLSRIVSSAWWVVGGGHSGNTAAW
jgi:hypothetical protein